MLNQYRNARRELEAARGQGGAEQERLLLALQWLTSLRGELASGLASGMPAVPQQSLSSSGPQ